jgi:hypothetical protein
MLGFAQHDMSKLLSLSGRFCKGSYSDNSDMVKAVSFFLRKWIHLGGPAVHHSCNFGAYSCCKLTFLGAGWFRAWNIRQCWMQEFMVKLLEGECKLHFVCKASFVPSVANYQIFRLPIHQNKLRMKLILILPSEQSSGASPMAVSTTWRKFDYRFWYCQYIACMTITGFTRFCTYISMRKTVVVLLRRRLMDT